jgi:hypothetical protein
MQEVAALQAFLEFLFIRTRSGGDVGETHLARRERVAEVPSGQFRHRKKFRG